MTQQHFDNSIMANCQPLMPRATGLKPKLSQLGGIRAVLFDIYGTLLISASGDIGANSGDHRLLAIEQTAGLFDLQLCCSPRQAIQSLENEIAVAHAMSKSRGIKYPEVDIVAIWREVIPKIVKSELSGIDFERFALEYEVRVNPVWPMPDLELTLTELSTRELVLGIVSNAQFFTPQLFPAFLKKTLGELGFDPELLYFSYQQKQAKPGTFLYELARQELATRGIGSMEVLYVGNDMLNDIAAAASVGFRTVLFAGDRRSLRMREGDHRVQCVEPNVIVTELPQLLECLIT